MEFHLIQVHHFTDAETKACSSNGGSRPGSQKPRLLCLFISSLSKPRTQFYLLFPCSLKSPSPKILDWLSLGATLSLLLLSSFTQLKEKYGPVFTVYMGPRPVVILCGHEAVKEALVDRADEFSGRGELASIERNFQGHGR